MGFLNIPEKQKIFQIDEQQINYTSHVNHLIDPPELVIGYITHCFLVKSLKTWSSVTYRWSHSKNRWEFQAKKHYQESRNFAATHSTFSKLLLNIIFFRRIDWPSTFTSVSEAWNIQTFRVVVFGPLPSDGGIRRLQNSSIFTAGNGIIPESCSFVAKLVLSVVL